MAQRFINKVAVITGSSDGIGFAIAERFLKEGSKVVISSRKLKNVNYAVEKLKQNFNPSNIRGIVCHVGEMKARQNLFSETVENFGKIDVLVSNAGTNIHTGPAIECSEETWDKMLDTNLKSAFFLIKEALPYFNEKGSIIVNSSISGYNPIPMLGIYSIAKTALIGMVKVLSQELANSPQTIRVNGIAPGIIKTKFSRVIHENEILCDETMKHAHLKRFGVCEDCAGLVAFLASEDASYITGEIVVVAGGLPSRL